MDAAPMAYEELLRLMPLTGAGDINLKSTEQITIMDQYSLVKVIGKGSFGRALLVQPISEEQNYVMKEIRLPKIDSGIRNSRREAVLLSRMKHPNIVAFRDSFEDDGHLYIVMEFCSGGDLFQRIQQQKNVLFAEDMILKWFAQMCLGTKHIHDKRVLHRDLKAKNIFLTDSGTVKVGDFGSACSLNSAKAYAQTYVGTPYYVSPEIWDNRPYNNKRVTHASYLLVTSRKPVSTDSNGAEYSNISPTLSGTDGGVNNSQHSKAKHKELVREQTHRWRREEGEKVAMFLEQKSLVTTTTTEGPLQVEQSPVENNSTDDPASRKKWVVGTCNTVLGVLGNADIISTGSMENAERADLISEAKCGEIQERQVRKQWDKDPPERLLSVLEKAQLCYGFETYTIRRDEHGDKVDGPEKTITDYSRLEPRSDDEDTDFEEEYSYDWINELEKMVDEH
ncbi:serine threonine- kinase Nek3 [Labeo rohita]|uniref:Serine threonine-kinase Nek3 n=1 Tax=Labeo rohita TaxID=84645 RepID=A0A498N140_LABRO|nr:serine threonine- kinase Nek3 [Labeo rohita]